MTIDGKPGVEWHNYVGEQRFTPARTFKPDTEEQVAEVVAQAVADDQRVHVAGAGHASSPLVRTDGFLVDTSALTGVQPVHDADLLAPTGGHHVRVLAGTRLFDLDAALDRLGLAMPNLGSATFQSIYGAIATGTHGSGAGFGALCDLVRSVDLVDGSGNRLRVEPAAGFTRPDLAPPGVTVTCDDDLFRSVVVGVGVAGLVTSLVLEVTEIFDLEETRTLATWQALKGSPDTDAAIRAAPHWEMWLNPYADVDGNNTALVTVRAKAPTGTPRNPRPDPWELRVKPLREAMVFALDALPFAVRPALDMAMRSQATMTPHVDASYRIFDLGSVNDMPAVATEWFFPMDRWKDAVDALLRAAARLAVRSDIGGVPFGVRFIKASPHFLAMTRGEPDEVFCSVELPVYSTEHDRRTLMVHYERIAARHRGRPHWGQLHRTRPGKLAERYPEIDRWKAARARLDPQERFANFTSHAEGLTPSRMPHPVIGDVGFYDTSVVREVLPMNRPGSTAVMVDRRRFRVEASAAEVARALNEVMIEPGLLIGRRFMVVRAEDRTGKPFEVGEHFQGRFALDEQLLEDTRPKPPLWTRLLRKAGVQKALQYIEDHGLADYGMVERLELDPAPGQPYAIRYAYTTGTPFSGYSDFTVAPIDAGRCLYTERITFQPENELARLSMELIGIRLHNQVVFGQVEATADRLGVEYEPLDPDDLGKATGP